jgi:multiple sugar transport system permease protein
MTAKAFNKSATLAALSGSFLALWSAIALFPLFWIALMSVRVPVDALSSNPLNVILGPATREIVGGLSLAHVAAGAGLVAAVLAFARGDRWLWAFAGLTGALAVGAMAGIPGLRGLDIPIIGFTAEHYRAIWVDHGFYRNFINSLIVTGGVVTVSLAVGTLAGYGLARSRSSLAFWLLIVALVFRALPHSVLVSGYLPAFVSSRELLQPLWQWSGTAWFFQLFGPQPPTLYGQPWAIIVVLVSINQPFTIWMLRAFFSNIPSELDEAARVDGCSQIGAFWRVIVPVMWPGIITTGLFSFLLAYNDYLVTSLLLDAQSQTMVPAITSFLNRDSRGSDQIEAIAAAVSIIAPLFVLVMIFQKQIVAGLTQGAVKG